MKKEKEISHGGAGGGTLAGSERAVEDGGVRGKETDRGAARAGGGPEKKKQEGPATLG